MGSLGIPVPPPLFYPFMDCSREICSAFCPQWCDVMFSPPPPLFGLEDNGDSGTYFSPLIVAIIGILASAFILVTYYAIVSKYCRRRGDGDAGIGLGDDFENDRVINDTRQSGTQPGLDEALIKSISVYKYKRGEGLVEGTDCSVCLSEFQENESLRLLPKCSHAFHLACIDTWLKSNSSCPLCRCNIAATKPPTEETAPPTVSALGYRRSSDASVLVVQDLPDNASQEAVVVEIVTDATPAPASQDQGGSSTLSSERVDGRPDRSPEDSVQSLGRSVTAESSPPCQGSRSVAEISSVSHEDGEEAEAADSATGVGIEPSDGEGKDHGKSRNGNGVFNLPMKKSISSGIFVFSWNGKGRSSSNLPN